MKHASTSTTHGNLNNAYRGSAAARTSFLREKSDEKNTRSLLWIELIQPDLC